MQHTDLTTRRLWQCGHLPTAIHIAGGEPPRRHEPDHGLGDTELCPGYYVNLPDVAEVALAHAWWDHGQLRDHCDGETPTRMLRDCVTALASAYSEIEAWVLHEARGEGK